jgi:hypothetical protein
LPGTAIPVFTHIQYSWPRFLDLRHIVEFVVLLFDHHAIFIDSFVFQHFGRADAIHILDKPTHLFARPEDRCCTGSQSSMSRASSIVSVPLTLGVVFRPGTRLVLKLAAIIRRF